MGEMAQKISKVDKEDKFRKDMYKSKRKELLD